MSSDAATSSSVLRPSRAAWSRSLQTMLWIAIPLLVISLVRILLTPWLLPVVVVGVAAGIVGTVLYFRRTRIEYGSGLYHVVSMWGRATTFTAGDVATLVTIRALNGGSIAPTAPQLILVRADGTPLLRLRGRTWDVQQFTALAEDLIEHGVVNDAILEQITTAQLRVRYPKVVGWGESHPIALGLLIGLGLVTVFVAAAIAIAFLGAA